MAVMAAGFVYILTSQPYGTLYIGVTSNLHERMMQHQAGIGSAFVKNTALRTWFILKNSLSMQMLSGAKPASSAGNAIGKSH
jgi:putative endonuclease